VSYNPYYYPWYWQRPYYPMYNPAMWQTYPSNYQYSTQYYPQLQQGYYPPQQQGQGQLGLGTNLAGVLGFGALKWIALRGLAGY
jgi:hypothetical protein